LQKSNQWREWGAQLVRKHPKEKFLGSHGGFGKGLLQLEFLLNLVTLRQVGQFAIVGVDTTNEQILLDLP